MVLLGDVDEAGQARQGGGEGEGHPVVPAGGKDDPLVSLAEGVLHLGEGDPVLLGARGVGPFEFEEELAEAVLLV